ncbi:DUF4974 domain-containing protein [Mucilaginibacter gynuensis]|uniref:DUF4974 domain-containing protein n=1 Tax=Mucilaginibacter gynuensis TaxID=1302236 RepID=A0ABP8FTP0_9SPHI
MNQDQYILLYEKFLAGQCTEAEKELLLKYIDGFELKEHPWEDTMGDREAIKHEIYDRLATQVQPVKKSTSSKRLWWSAAASVLLVLVSVVFYKYRQGQDVIPRQNIAARVHIVKPGGNKAVLTLADGTKIPLDNDKKGLVTDKDGVPVKQNTNGQLVYDLRGKKGKDNTGGKKIKEEELAAVMNTITTPIGGQYQVILEDGTKVWLNAASSLKFPTVFNGKERNVEVTGEVYFEVAKNVAKPFNVTFNGNKISVLGTHFNVNAYAEEAKSKVTLLEGSVKLSNTAGSAMLKPGMQALVTDEHSAITTRKANLEAAVAWKNGYFLFEDENIQSIMRKLARWYNIEAVYTGNMKGKEFSGSVSKFENVTEVLDMLELTGSVHFNLEGRRIKVMP